MLDEGEEAGGRSRGIGLSGGEPGMSHADVVGRDVEDQADAAFASRCPKRSQRGIPAEVSGDVLVVDAVVAMVG